jgi:hypothetical protein
MSGSEVAYMQVLRQTWARSKTFRFILILAAVYALVRLAIHAFFMAELLRIGTEGYDLQLYLDAAHHLQTGQDLYPKGALDYVEFFQYAPSYALAFTLLLGLGLPTVMIVLSLAHVVAYGLLYGLWARIFGRLGLDGARETLAWLLPLWLVFSQFWADLGYLNIYVFMALLSTLLIDGVLHERLGWSVLWLAIILQTKPQWAFAAAVPLLLGRYRFFFKLLALSIVAYAAVVGVVMLAAGPAYGWQQYVDYAQFLLNMRGNLVWRSLDAPFLGYDHSITQIVVYLLGATPATLGLATGVKVLLLIPLAAVGLRHLRRPTRRPGQASPRLGLDLAFVLYLGAFIWLDVVWEITFGIVVFTYLLATLEERNDRIWAWVIFLPYALVDLWQIISVATFGFDIVAPGPFVLTDPAIYVPLVMIVILAFYALLIKRLWATVPPLRLKESQLYGR